MDQGMLGRVHGLASTLFFIYLMAYYLTGAGGPMLLAVTMVPVALAVVYLDDARQGGINGVLAVTVATVVLVAAVYLFLAFDDIRVTRVGIWSLSDHLAGGVVALAALEHARRRYFPLFVLTIGLLVYALTGPYWPGAMRHGGMDLQRISSMTSLEMSTGVFERLPQLGLTLIGAFILVLAALRAFGCIDAILRTTAGLAARRPALLPQAAVAGSFAVAAVSGSGAANAATTGSATIPALIRSGLPKVQAAAIETASSLGGQLMPPLMGIAAFMMADLLGVSYFDVAARGFAPALVYFVTVSFTVWLLSTRYPPVGVADTPEGPAPGDRLRLAAYAAAVTLLIVFMGVFRQPAMVAAQQVFWILLATLGLQHYLRWWNARDRSPAGLGRPYARLVATFSGITAELTVLLAVLGILTAAFTVTGVPTKVGLLVMDMAAVHVILMVVVAALFGLLVGMGLPAAPTYIILAVVVAPFMIEVGVDPWVAHFFAFFVAVFGELTPPTSVTAAVAARIADAPFLATMFAALRLASPLILMMAAVFTRPELVLAPGLAQLGAWAMVTTGCIGVAYALHERRLAMVPLAAVALLALFHPDTTSAAVSAFVTTFLVMGLLYQNRARD